MTRIPPLWPRLGLLTLLAAAPWGMAQAQEISDSLDPPAISDGAATTATPPTLPAPAADGQNWIRDAYHRSFGYERTENHGDAIRALTPVLERFPNGYTLHLRLGWLHYLMGRYANSIDHYQAAIRAAPQSIEAKLGLTQPLLAQGRHAEAERLCNQILNADYFNYFGNLRLVRALRGQGKSHLALQVVQRLRLLYPTDIPLLEAWGEIQEQQGESAQAAAIFREVLILDPENEIARRGLARRAIHADFVGAVDPEDSAP